MKKSRLTDRQALVLVGDQDANIGRLASAWGMHCGPIQLNCHVFIMHYLASHNLGAAVQLEVSIICEVNELHGDRKTTVSVVIIACITFKQQFQFWMQISLGRVRGLIIRNQVETC